MKQCGDIKEYLPEDLEKFDKFFETYKKNLP